MSDTTAPVHTETPNPTAEVSTSRAVRHLLARWVDLIIFCLMIGFLLGIVFPEIFIDPTFLEGGKGKLLQFGLIWLTVPLELLVMALFGNTLGKSLMGIRVVDSETGKKIRLKQAAIRQLWVFLSGLACWTFVIVLTGPTWFMAIRKGKPTAWDEEAKTRVEYRPFGRRLKFAMGLAGFSLFMLFICNNVLPLLGYDSDRWFDESWTNPVTQVETTLPFPWQTIEIEFSVVTTYPQTAPSMKVPGPFIQATDGVVLVVGRFYDYSRKEALQVAKKNLRELEGYKYLETEHLAGSELKIKRHKYQILDDQGKALVVAEEDFGVTWPYFYLYVMVGDDGGLWTWAAEQSLEGQFNLESVDRLILETQKTLKFPVMEPSGHEDYDAG